MNNKRKIPVKTNIAIALILLLLNLYQFIFLPLFLLPKDHLWAFTLIPLFIVNNTLWALIHEAIHKIFHPNIKINEFWGRILSIIHGSSFHILRFGHMMHHSFNRKWESEIYDEKKSSWFKNALYYYFQLLGGLYLIEVLTTFATLLPKTIIIYFINIGAKRESKKEIKNLATISSNYFFSNNKIAAMRLDAIAIIIFFTVSFYLYNQFWYLSALIILTRAMIISIFDNAPHYATPYDNSVAAKELKTSNLISKIILNLNFHRTHHLYPTVTWNMLPVISRDNQANHKTESLFYALLKQLLGPVKES